MSEATKKELWKACLMGGIDYRGVEIEREVGWFGNTVYFFRLPETCSGPVRKRVDSLSRAKSIIDRYIENREKERELRRKLCNLYIFHQEV